MSFGHALYYPHINLTNKNWLKYSLLYWDKISRIVPASVEPTDSEDIIRVRSELDFIEDYSPDPRDVSQAGKDFFTWFADHRHDPDVWEYYQARYGIPPDHLHHFRPERRNRGSLYGALNRAARVSGTYIHVDKLDREAKEFLFETGIAIPGENQWRDWVRIDGEIGLLYMSYLAQSISAKTSRAMVTDELEAYANSQVLQSAVPRRHEEELQHRMCTLLVAEHAPADMNAVTFDQLIRFRKKHDGDRVQFFNHVNDLCSDISQISNEAQFTDALNHHMTALKKDVDELGKQFASMRIEPVLRFICISVPTSCMSLVKYVPDESKGLVVAAGAVLGAAGALHEYAKEKRELEANPLSYLLSLKSGIQASSLLDGLRDAMRWA